MNSSWDWSRVVLSLVVICVLHLGMPLLWAQTLREVRQFDVAVQGRTGAQPEGAFFNLINWIGTLWCLLGRRGLWKGCSVPVGTAGRTFAACVAALLAVYGLTRLLEFWILQLTGGIS